MKNSDERTILFDTKLVTNKNVNTDIVKTTNVNVLLNRVRLDQKRDFKKKIIFLSLLVFGISSVAIFVII